MKISRRAFLKTCAAAGLAGGLGYGGIIEPKQVTLERVKVRIAELPTSFDGFRIAILSDFHLHPCTPLSLIEKAVDLANSLQTDMVALLGDYGSTRNAINELAPVFARFKAKHGIFAILGNHDRGVSYIVQNALREIRIPVLRNEGLPIKIGGETLFVAGTESIFFGFDLFRALRLQPKNAPTILLTHEPDIADTVSASGRVALQLSGHSHGGQMRIPEAGAILLPLWGRKYDKGLYKIRNMQLYTNCGLGVVGPPFRIHCPPEVTEITLVGS